jgi:phage-related protein
MSKSLEFRGRSQAELLGFTKAAMAVAGYELDKVQNGEDPSDWKPIKQVGPGTREVRVKIEDGIFRVFYVATLETKVYVLLAFQKKTQKTPKSIIDTARQRYKDLIKELNP